MQDEKKMIKEDYFVFAREWHPILNCLNNNAMKPQFKSTSGEECH